MFEPDPNDDEALRSLLGEHMDLEGPGSLSPELYLRIFGTPPPPTRSRTPRTDIELKAPPAPPPSMGSGPTNEKLKALLTKMPVTPSSSQLLDTLRNAKPVTPQMRAATPEERALDTLADDPANESMARMRFSAGGPKPAPGPTAMRAASPKERVNDTLNDLMTRFQRAVEPEAEYTRATTVPQPATMAIDPTMGTAAPEKIAGKGARAILEELFPKLDAYAKQKSMLSPAKVLEMVQSHPGATDEMITAATNLAAKGGRKMKPAEVVDVLSGVKHDKGRVLRQGVERVTTKKLSGAPLWVTSPKKEAQALDNYLQQVEQGVPGADFYKASGKSFLEYSGDDPAVAHKLGRAMSATSPVTEVSVNTGFGIKGHNQATAGLPVKTGRFPKNMSPPIEQVYRGEIQDLGPKREPFARQLAMGGGYADEGEKTTRAVHDIWEGEAFGYVNPDGTPLRRGFNEAEHKWMDQMTDRAVAEANAKKIGGKSDWDPGSLQAAAWTGARIRAGEIEAGEAAQSYADFMSRYHLQTGRESVPGGSTGHMPEFKDLPPEVQQTYHDKVREILYDPKGRDKAALAKGMLSGGSFEGPGIFTDAAGVGVNPGTQVRNVVGTATGPSGRIVDPASMGLVRANEAEFGLIGGQNAIAGTMLNPEAKAAERDLADLVLPSRQRLAVGDEVMGNPDVQQLLKGNQIALIPTEEGSRLKNIEMPQADFAALLKRLQKTTGGEVQAGKDLGFFEPQDWSTPEGAVGQHYARMIRDEIPAGKENFNKSAPQMAKAWHDLDVHMRDTYKVTLSDTLQQLRLAIADKGFDGINELATKLGVPLAVLMLALRMESPQQQQ